MTWVTPFCHRHLLMMSPSAFWLRWPRSVLFSEATNTSRMYRIAVLPHVMTAQVCHLCACAESDGIAIQCQHSAAFTSVRLRIVSLITVLPAYQFGALSVAPCASITSRVQTKYGTKGSRRLRSIRVGLDISLHTLFVHAVHRDAHCSEQPHLQLCGIGDVPKD